MIALLFVDVRLARATARLRVQETFWNRLSRDLCEVAQFALARSRTDVEHGGNQFLELGDSEGSIIVGAGQSEAVIDKILLARPVAPEHASSLWQGDV